MADDLLPDQDSLIPAALDFDLSGADPALPPPGRWPDSTGQHQGPLVLLIRSSLSWPCGVAELRMPEDGADPLRSSGQAAHVANRGSLQLLLAARRLLARERLLQVRVHAFIR